VLVLAPRVGDLLGAAQRLASRSVAASVSGSSPVRLANHVCMSYTAFQRRSRLRPPSASVTRSTEASRRR
jgi:hypothetical protein